MLLWYQLTHYGDTNDILDEIKIDYYWQENKQIYQITRKITIRYKYINKYETISKTLLLKLELDIETIKKYYFRHLTSSNNKIYNDILVTFVTISITTTVNS